MLNKPRVRFTANSYGQDLSLKSRLFAHMRPIKFESSYLDFGGCI
ncbi:hypothetical protein [Bartonella alsatica]|nr:hypothetical protein [Bartonella alsatica]